MNDAMTPGSGAPEGSGFKHKSFLYATLLRIGVLAIIPAAPALAVMCQAVSAQPAFTAKCCGICSFASTCLANLIATLAQLERATDHPDPLLSASGDLLHLNSPATGFYAEPSFRTLDE